MKRPKSTTIKGFVERTEGPFYALGASESDNYCLQYDIQDYIEERKSIDDTLDDADSLFAQVASVYDVLDTYVQPEEIPIYPKDGVQIDTSYIIPHSILTTSRSFELYGKVHGSYTNVGTWVKVKHQSAQWVADWLREHIGIIAQMNFMQVGTREGRISCGTKSNLHTIPYRGKAVNIIQRSDLVAWITSHTQVNGYKNKKGVSTIYYQVNVKVPDALLFLDQYKKLWRYVP